MHSNNFNTTLNVLRCSNDMCEASCYSSENENNGGGGLIESGAYKYLHLKRGA